MYFIPKLTLFLMIISNYFAKLTLTKCLLYHITNEKKLTDINEKEHHMR